MQTILYALFGLLLLSPITGELLRIPLFGFDLFPSDLIIPVLLVVWAIDKIRNDRILRLGRVGKSILFFLLVLIVTYCINLFRFDPGEMVSAGAYLARYALYLSVAFVTFDLLQREKHHRFTKLILVCLGASFLLVSILGFLQLVYYPSFFDLEMNLEGWDPHIGRLLSTWFDPNYVGGFFAFISALLISLALHYRQAHDRRRFLGISVLSLIGLVALYFTFSRSAYLAFLVALGILALLKFRKLLVAAVAIILLAFCLSSRVQERTIEAVDSGKAFLGLNSQIPLDPTAELRLWSWSFATEIISEHPWVGIGYNRYKYEINDRGHALLEDHAASGSDSSLLTLWATGGIFALLSFLAIGFVATVTTLRRSWKRHDLKSALDVGLLAGFGGMMVHSIFVNSLLYPLIMVYLLVGLGMMDEIS
jgi:O-antigen ligase